MQKTRKIRCDNCLKKIELHGDIPVTCPFCGEKIKERINAHIYNRITEILKSDKKQTNTLYISILILLDILIGIFLIIEPIFSMCLSLGLGIMIVGAFMNFSDKTSRFEKIFLVAHAIAITLFFSLLALLP